MVIVVVTGIKKGNESSPVKVIVMAKLKYVVIEASVVTLAEVIKFVTANELLANVVSPVPDTESLTPKVKVPDERILTPVKINDPLVNVPVKVVGLVTSPEHVPAQVKDITTEIEESWVIATEDPSVTVIVI